MYGKQQPYDVVLPTAGEVQRAGVLCREQGCCAEDRGAVQRAGVLCKEQGCCAASWGTVQRARVYFREQKCSTDGRVAVQGAGLQCRGHRCRGQGCSKKDKGEVRRAGDQEQWRRLRCSAEGSGAV